MLPHLRRARAAQLLAARALLSLGPAHPRVRRLLALAGRAAARAWDAGHHVSDLHRLTHPGASMPTSSPQTTPAPTLRRFRREHGDPTTWTTSEIEGWLHRQDAAHAALTTHGKGKR
ncbi:hypothetical protein [Streptomyces sp. NRRL F-5630]|uniref:hypothetical protein n=1 Tax=Streptomyces sp. NRRL F-5630 TaxID=1463864 RepID=UPI000A766C0C|nr:hypothetical protein [Streptomyces sp. NRRL F-5630]